MCIGAAIKLRHLRDNSLVLLPFDYDVRGRDPLAGAGNSHGYGDVLVFPLRTRHLKIDNYHSLSPRRRRRCGRLCHPDRDPGRKGW